MRIDQITIKNVIGARQVDAKLRTPVTLFCGGNGAGKSSIAEAVRMALTGDVRRVAMKKEYPAIVTEGAKAGYAGVITEAGEYGLDLPGGKGVNVEDAPALPFALEPSRFASVTPDERRTFLFGLAGIKIDGAEVLRRMKDRGCDETLANKVLPMLRSGFPAAAKFAADEAKDAKGAWRGVTGETYGAVKAETWAAPVPECDPERVKTIEAGMAKIDASVAEMQRNAGALEERAKQHEAGKAARELAAKLPMLREKLARDEAELESWRSKVEELRVKAGAPREGLVHDLARGLDYLARHSVGFDTELATDGQKQARAALEAYKAKHGSVHSEADPEAAAFLPKAVDAYELMVRTVANDRRDIAAAEAAQATTGSVDAFDAAALNYTRDQLVVLRRDRAALAAEAEQRNAALRSAQQAEAKTAEAARHHAEVHAWTKIADALAPDGIPGELLASALKPINDRLRSSAVATDWMQVAIGADMEITAAGRPYGLLSESEQWRTDAMLAEAISHLSHLCILMLDRMDVLELGARGDLLGWLADLADADQIETALVFATLKAPPTGLPESITPIWIENGEISNPQLQRAA